MIQIIIAFAVGFIANVASDLIDRLFDYIVSRKNDHPSSK